MPDIVITEFMDGAAVDALAGEFDTRYDPALADAQDRIPALLGDARAVIVRNRTQVRRELLDAAPGLVCVGRLGVGLDNIDVAACEGRGIEVCPATGANDGAVAEYVIAAAMALLRGAYGATAEVASGSWPRQALIGREIAGKTLGLVGFGAIARQTASRARALGMTIAAHDPYLPPENPAWEGVRNLSLDMLLAQSDVVSLHIPLTEETRHLMGAEQIDRMKPGSVLINAARGGVVDEAALAAALRSGSLSGAALDVFETEPLSAANGARFEGISNLILTPHIAGVTEESNVRVSSLIASRVAEILRR
ncbi:MAG: hydroxyacid dehydrogenase [Paracoccaceae bacterium]